MLYSHGGRKSPSSLGIRCTFVASDLERDEERRMDNDNGLRNAMLIVYELARRKLRQYFDEID